MASFIEQGRWEVENVSLMKDNMWWARGTDIFRKISRGKGSLGETEREELSRSVIISIEGGAK